MLFLVGSMVFDKLIISLVLLVYGGGGIFGVLFGGCVVDCWLGLVIFVVFLFLYVLVLVLLLFVIGGLLLLLGVVVFWCVFNMVLGLVI